MPDSELSQRQLRIDAASIPGLAVVIELEPALSRTRIAAGSGRVVRAARVRVSPGAPSSRPRRGAPLPDAGPPWRKPGLTVGSKGRWAYDDAVTTREKIEKLLDQLSEPALEAEYERLLAAVEERGMMPLPDGWGQTRTGEPMPDVAAALHRSRASR